MVTWVGLTVVDVTFTKCALITFSTAALKPIGPIVAFCSILTRRAGALVYVYLTHGTRKAWLACAREAIDHIPTYPIIHAWVTLTVIHISLAVCAHVAWHADAGELSNPVKTGGIILAGHGQAFIDVNLTTWAGISPATLTLERPLCVHTFSKMLTWVCTN